MKTSNLEVEGVAILKWRRRKLLCPTLVVDADGNVKLLKAGTTIDWPEIHSFHLDRKNK